MIKSGRRVSDLSKADLLLGNLHRIPRWTDCKSNQGQTNIPPPQLGKCLPRRRSLQLTSMVKVIWLIRSWVASRAFVMRITQTPLPPITTLNPPINLSPPSKGFGIPNISLFAGLLTSPKELFIEIARILISSYVIRPTVISSNFIYFFMK